MPKILQKLFSVEIQRFIKIVVWALFKLSFEHFFVELALFLSFEHFLKMGFWDLFHRLFTTQIIPDLIFSIWQAYILLSRNDNVAEQTVTVRFDADKTTSEKLRQSFEKFGYKARILKKGEKVKTDTKEKCELM